MLKKIIITKLIIFFLMTISWAEIVKDVKIEGNKRISKESLMVFGEINRPGSYYPYAGYSLTQLISDSGINQLTADAKNVFVMRENFEEELQIDVFKLNIKNPINLITGRKFLLNKRDIIYIPPSDLVKWNRVISLLLPQTNLFKSYNPIIQSGLSANNLEVQ